VLNENVKLNWKFEIVSLECLALREWNKVKIVNINEKCLPKKNDDKSEWHRKKKLCHVWENCVFTRFEKVEITFESLLVKMKMFKFCEGDEVICELTMFMVNFSKRKNEKNFNKILFDCFGLFDKWNQV
jgi:hypothetical protein